ncbi:MAG: MucR family transcriptional regulator [Parvibaculaceae bacterium]|nr:MucR family transcriptional regulator [Parvibaculaceae bacterium]
MTDTITTDLAHQEELLQLVADIVSAYVSNNSVAAADLPGLIKSIASALSQLSRSEEPVQERVPAVAVKKSVTPEFIICLEDGKKLKMLKRYLRSQYGLSPEEYRQRWGLPADYPMVAPNYAEQRSRLAKQIGLGRGPAVETKPRRRRA